MVKWSPADIPSTGWAPPVVSPTMVARFCVFKSKVNSSVPEKVWCESQVAVSAAVPHHATHRTRGFRTMNENPESNVLSVGLRMCTRTKELQYRDAPR